MKAKGVLVQGTCAALLAASAAAAAAAAPVPGTSCSVLPADNVWNTDISLANVRLPKNLKGLLMWRITCLPESRIGHSSRPRNRS